MRLTAPPRATRAFKNPESFIIYDPNRLAISYFYYDDDPHSRPVNKRFASPHPEASDLVSRRLVQRRARREVVELCP